MTLVDRREESKESDDILIQKGDTAWMTHHESIGKSVPIMPRLVATVTGLPLETILMTQVNGYASPVLPYQMGPLILGIAIGGVAAVLLEFADARIRSGVWDHSVYPTDPLGRSPTDSWGEGTGDMVPAQSALQRSREILDELRAYKAEIGVVGDIAPGPEFDTVPLGGAEIIAFAQPELLPRGASALPLSYLIQLPLVMRETGSKTRQKVEEEAARQGLRLTPGIVAEGREAVRELVASGAGVGFVSRAELGADDRVRAVSIEGAGLRMEETLVCLSQRRDLRLIRTVMDLARRG